MINSREIREGGVSATGDEEMTERTRKRENIIRRLQEGGASAAG